MEKRNKEYNGIWKTTGCLLSVVALLGLVFLFGLGLYFLLKGY